MQVADTDPVTQHRVPTEQPSPHARLSPLSRVSQVEMLLTSIYPSLTAACAGSLTRTKP
jgi:hypothetical protein